MTPVRGLRAGWLVASLLALGSTALPWGCNETPLHQAGRWAAQPPPSPLFALEIGIPLLVLAIAATLEAREVSSVVRRGLFLATSMLVSLASAIGAFGTRLAQPGFRIGRDVQIECPPPVAFFHGARSAALALLLFAPIVALVLAVSVRRTPPRLALRLLASHAFVATALRWTPYCDRIAGPLLGLLAGASLLITASFVDDPIASVRTRRAIALAALALVVSEAAITLPLRGSFRRQIDRAQAARTSN